MSSIRKYFEKYTNYLKGVSTLNIFGEDILIRPSWMDNDLTPNQKDYYALKSDWEKVAGKGIEKTVKRN